MNLDLDDLKVDKYTENSIKRGYLYKDLMLDVEYDISYQDELFTSQVINDVRAIYDVACIKASIKNIFMSAPGSKILNPKFGLDLRYYLFEPITPINAKSMERIIFRGLPKMDTRIVTSDVSVEPMSDDQEYIITLSINVPSLNIKNLSIKGVLNNSTGLTII